MTDENETPTNDPQEPVEEGTGPDFAGAANPGGTLDDTRPSILKCGIEYLAKGVNPMGFEKGLLSFSNAQGPMMQERIVKVVWLSTRELMKWATPYGDTPRTLCASYDGRVPSLGETQASGPCSQIQDGKPKVVCPRADWTAVCRDDASHVIPDTSMKNCPGTKEDGSRCNSKNIKKVPPVCRQIFVGLFYSPELNTYMTFWFWKTANDTLKELFKTMKGKAITYDVPPSTLPAGLTVTLGVKPVKNYYVPHFPEIDTDGTPLWSKTTEEVMDKIKANWAEVTRIFESLRFFGVPAGDVATGDTANDDIPF
jgi:hypothetical protein